MTASSSAHNLPANRRNLRNVVLISAGLLVFCAVFVLIDQTYIRLLSVRFPNAASSASRATVWGLLSRAHWIALLLPFVVMKPKQIGLRFGEIAQHWLLLLGMLVFNCGIILVYLLLSRGSTPYSGNQWFITEVITVPFVEEIFWRGLAFSVLYALLKERTGGRWALTMAVWLSGIAFGLLHASNVLAGVPVEFVAIQTLSAGIWGVTYGYARARTGSVYPSIVMHAAMNLIVIAF